MSSQQRRLHFHRYEFKYLISGDTRAAVLCALENRMERDSYSTEDGSYFVRSLYFDTSSFRCHRDKEDGLHSRYKFRIRSYSAELCEPVFLELKGKYDNLVYKHRQLLRADGLADAMEGGIGALCSHVMEGEKYNGVGRHFVADCFRSRLAPSLVVDYSRTAFENSANPDFRATLDTAVTARKSGRNGVPCGHCQDLAPSFSVLEIKFRYHLPAWFHRMVQGYQLCRVPFSKFHLAGERLWMCNTRSLLDRMVERGRCWPL